jgi:hypothetical protein
MSNGRRASIGAASLAFSGAFERQAEGRGVQLAGDHIAHLVLSGDLQGPQSDLDWILTLAIEDDEDDDDVEVCFAQLAVFVDGEPITQRTYTLPNGHSFEFVAGAYVLDAELEGNDGTVRVQGRVEVPRWPAASDEHRAIHDQLRAAGYPVRPFAFVAHGSVEPLSREQALISLVTPRSQGHDKAEELRAHLPDGWTAWVGEDEPGHDQDLTYAEGPDGLPMKFEEYPVQVVCSPGSDEEVLAWSRFNPPDAGFGAGALLAIIERWRQSFDFVIVEACHDSLVLQLDSDPPDLEALAAELHELSPDPADYFLENEPDGTSPQEAIANRIRDLGDIELWWT